MWEITARNWKSSIRDPPMDPLKVEKKVLHSNIALHGVWWVHWKNQHCPCQLLPLLCWWYIRTKQICDFYIWRPVMNDCCYNPPTHIFQKGWSVQIIASWYMGNFPHTMYTFRFKGHSYDIAENIVSVPLSKAEESGWGSSNNIAAVNAVDTPPTHFFAIFCSIFFTAGVWSSHWGGSQG